MATARPSRRASYEDLLKVPENLVAEIIDGELLTFPRPAVPHAVSASALGGVLSAPFQFGAHGPGGWWLLDEPELHFGEDVLVPDLAGWRRERMPKPPDAAAITLPPDWVCEVVSPSTEKHDRTGKLTIYGREGVKSLWFVNPLTRTLEVLELRDARWTVLSTHRDDAIVRGRPFDAIDLDLLHLWGEDRGPPP